MLNLAQIIIAVTVVALDVSLWHLVVSLVYFLLFHFYVFACLVKMWQLGTGCVAAANLLFAVRGKADTSRRRTNEISVGICCLQFFLHQSLQVKRRGRGTHKQTNKNTYNKPQRDK